MSSTDLTDLVAEIKAEFDLGSYFNDRTHTATAEALLDGLAEQVRRRDAAIQAVQALCEKTEQSALWMANFDNVPCYPLVTTSNVRAAIAAALDATPEQVTT